MRREREKKNGKKFTRLKEHGLTDPAPAWPASAAAAAAAGCCGREKKKVSN